MKKTCRRLFSVIRPFKAHFIWALLSALIGVALTLAVPVLIGLSVDKMLAAGQVEFAALYPLLAILAAVIAVSALFQWLMTYHSNKLAYLTTEALRNAVLNKWQHVPIAYLDKHAHGDLLSTAMNDIDIIGIGLLQGFTQVMSGCITILGTLIFMFVLNPVIALVVVLLTPLSFFVATFISKNTHDKYRKQATLRGRLTAFATEMIQNEALVKSFSMEAENEQTFETLNTDLKSIGVQAHFFSALANPCTRFVNATVYAGVAAIGAVFCTRGQLSIGELTSFLAYCSQYTKPFNEISGVVAEFQNALSSAARVFHVLDAKEESDASAQTDWTAPNGDVALSNLQFGYRKDVPVLQNLSLHLAPGETVALVGPTGCGKTTLINLLMRFYDAQSGTIQIDGENIQNLPRKELRSAFGMVLQDTWLFEGTVRENIAFGRPGATEAEIVEAAKSAHAHHFIQCLPDGYDTLLHENGNNISEGQRQLLSIARVMLAKPPILILDEATSNIDTRTEARIQKAFGRLLNGRTALIVAHRLSTIQNADKIVVMQHGEIVEIGTHLELLEKQGVYKQLYASQFANID